ncbi:hypothetical protein BX666DRAFT_1105642 [Dichotomocladium elegans]|nr:hypothetical protein BX666DRAFT_1105642 [Dichotomocladium elegans]
MSQIVPDGLDLLANLLENDTEVFPYPDIRVALQDYVYGGSYHDMALRRIYAWFLIMLHPSYIYKCTHSLVKWSLCDKGKTWDQDLEEAAAYLSWVISPSDDDRMTESHDRLHAWLTALKAHVSGIDNDTLPFKSLLCTLYDDVSCGNVLVTLCMAVAVLSCIPFDRVGHIELLESVLLEYNAPHRVRCNSSSSTDMKVPSSLPKEFHQPALYIFLDLLPLWQQIFGDHSAILETLIQHVNTLISS